MGIYIWDTAPSKIFVWWSEVASVRAGDTKVRPSIQPITTAWIYWNSDLWLISISSDWSTWLTIADKNLWATQVYNSWDTLSEANCGKYYQAGNNYGFPFWYNWTNTTNRVNYTSYWPWNYYSSSTPSFLYTSGWFNWNLWGDITNTNIARKWPCENWYHIPSLSEADNLKNIMTSLWVITSSSLWNLHSYLKLPKAWRVLSNYPRVWSFSFYALSKIYDRGISSGIFSYVMTMNDTYRWRNERDTDAAWHPIRPFKNDAVQPDTSRTVLYQ